MRKIGELTTHDFRKALKERCVAFKTTQTMVFSLSFPKAPLDFLIH